MLHRTAPATRHLRPLAAAPPPRAKPSTPLCRRHQRPAPPAPHPAAALSVDAASPDAPPPPFAWRDHYYPVAYAADLGARPLRVELFDEPYVVARAPDGTLIAHADRCPHRGAALSEGRVTAGGHLQCAYHGWVVDRGTGEARVPAPPTGVAAPRRACAPPVPAVERQGMIFVAPIAPGSPAPSLDKLSLIPELNQPGYVSSDFVRAMPGVDASLLLCNVADPDHGRAAHQTTSFDAFVVPRGGAPMRVAEVKDEAGRVKAVVAETDVAGGGKNAATPAAVARLIFEAPSHARWARHGNGGKDAAKFLACFYAVPVGVGRSILFVRYVRSIATWLPIPRWWLAMGLNKFVDQDTYTLATQQPEMLLAEADSVSPLFRSRHVFATPTEKFLLAVTLWLESALPSAPNRAARLAAGAFDRSPPPRSVVLDRATTHAALAPSSARAAAVGAVVRNIGSVAALLAAAAAAGALGAGRGAAAAAPWAVGAAVAALAAAIGARVAAAFTYCYDRAAAGKDLERIAALVPELEG